MTRVLGGRYDLGEPLRRTGFGQVRVGTRRADDAPVAVELLDEALVADPGVRARCDTGEAALCAVSGRHLVRVQAVVVESTRIGVVRDRVGGSDLCALRAEAGGTLAPREAVALVVDVLDALSDLHAAGLVHGALRERDVLVDLDVPLRPVTRLTGYGTAALVRGRAVPTEDVVAAGRLLCVLLCGLEQLPAGLPEQLHAVLQSLLVEDSCLRPTAAQARDALADLPGLRGLAPLPPHDGPTGLAALLAPEQVVQPALPSGPPARPARQVVEPGTVASVSSWSPRPEPTEPPEPRPRLVVPRRPSRTTPAEAQDRPPWPPLSRRRALVVLPLSVALGAGVTAVAAATSPDRQDARAAAATMPSETVATYSFPPLRRPDGLRVERTWELRRSGNALSLHAATLVRNGPRRAVGAGLDEVVPRSVARDVSAVRFVPTPSTVVEGQPVVRYLARLDPGATTGWRWEVPVPAGTDGARLRELARDAEVARLVWESTRVVVRPTPARPVAEPTAVEPVDDAAGIPEPVRTARRPRAAAPGPTVSAEPSAPAATTAPTPGAVPSSSAPSPSPAAQQTAAAEPSPTGSG